MCLEQLSFFTELSALDKDLWLGNSSLSVRCVRGIGPLRNGLEPWNCTVKKSIWRCCIANMNCNAHFHPFMIFARGTNSYFAHTSFTLRKEILNFVCGGSSNHNDNCYFYELYDLVWQSLSVDSACTGQRHSVSRAKMRSLTFAPNAHHRQKKATSRSLWDRSQNFRRWVKLI